MRVGRGGNGVIKKKGVKERTTRRRIRCASDLGGLVRVPCWKGSKDWEYELRDFQEKVKRKFVSTLFRQNSKRRNMRIFRDQGEEWANFSSSGEKPWPSEPRMGMGGINGEGSMTENPWLVSGRLHIARKMGKACTLPSKQINWIISKISWSRGNEDVKGKNTPLSLGNRKG